MEDEGCSTSKEVELSDYSEDASKWPKRSDGEKYEDDDHDDFEKVKKI